MSSCRGTATNTRAASSLKLLSRPCVNNQRMMPTPAEAILEPSKRLNLNGQGLGTERIQLPFLPSRAPGTERISNGRAFHRPVPSTQQQVDVPRPRLPAGIPDLHIDPTQLPERFAQRRIASDIQTNPKRSEISPPQPEPPRTLDPLQRSQLHVPDQRSHVARRRAPSVTHALCLVRRENTACSDLAFKASARDVGF